MKAYHTSLTDFDAFDFAFVGSSTGWRGIAAGFFFSNREGQGSHVAEGSEGWITYVCELNIQNPAYAASYDEAEAQWGTEDAAMEALKAAGHDALILAGGEEIVVWNPEQIRIISKSAGALGA